MKRFVIIGIVLFATQLVAQTEKEEAKKAFMEIVSCYFKKDCAKFYSYFNDSVKIFGPGINNFISSKKLIEKKAICTRFDTIIYKTKTKENYLENYSIDIFTYEEFSTLNAKAIDNYFSENAGSKGGFVLSEVNYDKKLYNQNDFLIIGDIPIIKKEENFIGIRYIFMLRKTAKGWKIVGFR